VQHSSCKSVAFANPLSHGRRTLLPSISPTVSDPLSTTLLRQSDLNHNSASLLDLEMVLSRISYGHIVAFPDAADVHIFRTTIASSQHSIASQENLLPGLGWWEDLLILLDHNHL
jgi:hypothetical protein